MGFCTRTPGLFAILDAEGASAGDLTLARQTLVAGFQGLLWGANAALYAPSIVVRGACPTCGGSGRVTGVTAGVTSSITCPTCGGTGAGLVPPSGHVAGVYARTDDQSGIHKAPANETLEGALDLQLVLDDAGQAPLNALGVNCIRALPGRGVRVWGARTLSGDPAWDYVNVRRLFLTVGRWLEASLTGVAFEPNDLRLWARIGRDVGAFLTDLFQQGALQGETAGEAFFVKCDAETNPPASRDLGQVVTEVGIAPARPNEFLIVRLVNSPGGSTLIAGAQPSP